MEVSGQLHTLAALPPGKEPSVPLGYEAGWAPEPVWTSVKGTEVETWRCSWVARFLQCHKCHSHVKLCKSLPIFRHWAEMELRAVTISFQLSFSACQVILHLR
jgi:hypothetical protein